ncbi:OmpA family protein [Cytophaga aurantiaca]|uniref:OmpA family protein n=1 Tax=Cytophaga aurantiaca TaxID=29530 RepID=UPI000363ABD5|nr:OmpA family protein [Cytophaga aurantiaca]
MRILLSVFILLTCSHSLFAQNEFTFNDTVFHVGQKKTVHIANAYDGPCTVSPCYDLGDNKKVYDSIVAFLNQNKTLRVAFFWYSDLRGSDEYNLYQSNIMAKGLISILMKLGIEEYRISSIGMGEAFPVMTNEQIEKLKTDDEKFSAHSKNRRVEIIILSD